MKSLLTTLLVCLASYSGAQSPAQMQKMQDAMNANKPAGADALTADNGRPHRTPLRVFATFDDMVADKGVEGVEVDGDDIVNDLAFQKATLNVIDNGAKKSVPMKDCPYWGFTDGGGQVVRIHKGNAYISYALGSKHCFYQMVGTFENARDWVSNGPNADIEVGSRLVAAIAKDAGLKDEYDDAKPKREMRDSVEGYQYKLHDRDVSFLNRINGDSAVK